MSNFLQLQSFHICKQTVHKKKKYNQSSIIINNVLSPNYICTYQEKEIILLSTSASVQYSWINKDCFKKKTKKKQTSLPSMVVEILKAIQEESR